MTDGPDRWHRWLLDVRFGGDAAQREKLLTELLYPVRDTVLGKAQLAPGESLLDVGTGEACDFEGHVGEVRAVEVRAGEVHVDEVNDGCGTIVGGVAGAHDGQGGLNVGWRMAESERFLW